MTSDNRFERIRDTLQARLEKRKAVAYKAFGVGQRPYGTVALTKAQLRGWWASLTPEEKNERYNAMMPEERNEILKAQLSTTVETGERGET